MDELVKIKSLISLLDSYKFGGYSDEFMEYYIDNMISDAADLLLECLLMLKFKGISRDNAEYHLTIAKDYKRLIKDKN